MPFIHSMNTIDVSVEKFLDACSPSELMELRMLLFSPRFNPEVDIEPLAAELAMEKLRETFKNGSRG